LKLDKLLEVSLRYLKLHMVPSLTCFEASVFSMLKSIHLI